VVFPSANESNNKLVQLAGGGIITAFAGELAGSTLAERCSDNITVVKSRSALFFIFC
jgi:hypothetical protein